MRKQIKALIWASSITTVAATGIFLGTHFYGKTDAAKGTKIKFEGDREVDFSEFKMEFIDDSTGTEVKIGELSAHQLKDQTTDLKVNGQSPADFLASYKKDHPTAQPTFRITKGFFKLNNKYIEAVSVEDWLAFATWYLGYKYEDSSSTSAADADGKKWTKVPGHLPFGPEAGAIKTFQIVPGVSTLAGGGVVLGGRDSSKNEVDSITFYPDSFFGTFSLYDEMGDYMNRLLEPMFPDQVDASGNTQALEMTLEEVNEAIDLINKTNQFNKDYIATTKNLDPRISAYWSKYGADSFTYNGSNAPAPYTIQPSSLKSVNGQMVQYYKVYTEIYTRRDGVKGGDSILRILEKAYPGILQATPGPYVELDKATGKYTLKNGVHNEIPFSKKLGLPYILKAINPSFNGFGTDFLKYVSIHEYGHHFTLSTAQDASEGGATLGGWNGRTAPTAMSLYDLDILNQYLRARSNGLRVIKTDVNGTPVRGYKWEFLSDAEKKVQSNIDDHEYYKTFLSPYFAFLIPTTNTDPAVNPIPGYHIEKIDDITKFYQPEFKDKAPSVIVSRAFRESVSDLTKTYVDELAKPEHGSQQTSVLNALLQNAIDRLSGTLNPTLHNGPLQLLRGRITTTEGTNNAGARFVADTQRIFSVVGVSLNSYQINLMNTILKSTVQFTRDANDVTKVYANQNFDSSTWPEVEQNNLNKFLNFLYRKPEGYVWENGQTITDANGVKISTNVDKFLNFYVKDDFQSAWLQKGSAIENFKNIVYNRQDTDDFQFSNTGFGVQIYAAAGETAPIEGDTNAAFFNYDKSTVVWTDQQVQDAKQAYSAELAKDATYSAAKAKLDQAWGVLETPAPAQIDVDAARVAIDAAEVELDKAETEARKSANVKAAYDKYQQILKLVKQYPTGTSYGWTNFNTIVKQWTDGKGNPLFKDFTTGDANPFIFDAAKEFKDWNPFDGLDESTRRELYLKFSLAHDIWEYRDASNKAIQVHSAQVQAKDDTGKLKVDANGNPVMIPDENSALVDVTANSQAWQIDEAREILFSKLKHLIRTVTMISWSADGVSNDQITKGKYPFKSDVEGIFSDYVYSFPETMTRDFVQISYHDTADSRLRNTDPLLGVSQSSTSFEYYVNGEISKMYATQDEDGKTLPQNFVSGTDAAMWIKPLASTVRLGDMSEVSKLDGLFQGLSSFQKDLITKMDMNENNSGYMSQLFGIDAYNDVFGHDRFLSNGYEPDHQLKVDSSSQLYNKDGSARTIKPEDNIHILGPDGKTEAKTWAEAYWFFLLNEYGVGHRTVAALWRDSDLDKNHMYGYIPKEYSSQVKYLQFTDVNDSGKVIKVPIFSEEGVTDNLFYLTKQGDGSSAHTLADQGYASWTTDKNAVGIYLNSTIGIGSYEVDFVDKDGNVVKDQNGQSLFNMGERNQIAENGKFYRTAPTYFERTTADGKEVVVYHVNAQFNI